MPAHWSNISRFQQILEHQIKDKKKGLEVDLVYRYGQNADGSIPLPFVETSATPLTTTTGKKTITATTKLISEMEQKTAFQSTTVEQMNALNACHICKSRKCKNFDRYCWMNRDDQVHYSLNANHFTSWNNTINKNHGEAFIDQPPSFVVESLYRQKKMERKEGQKEEKKDSLSSTNLFRDTKNAVLSSISAAPMYFSGYPMPPPTYFLYYPPAPQPQSDLMTLLTLKEKRQIEREKKKKEEKKLSRPTSAYAPIFFCSGMEPRSSPVKEDLEEYIQWHIKHQPRKKAAFHDAYEKLDTAGYNVQAIQTWKGDAYEHKWKNLDIPAGIGLQLAWDASKFHKENLIKSMDQYNISRQYPLSPPKPSASLQAQKPPLSYRQATTKIETQEEDEDYLYDGQMHKSVEFNDDRTTNVNYDKGISDLDDIGTWYSLCITE